MGLVIEVRCSMTTAYLVQPQRYCPNSPTGTTRLTSTALLTLTALIFSAFQRVVSYRLHLFFRYDFFWLKGFHGPALRSLVPGVGGCSLLCFLWGCLYCRGRKVSAPGPNRNIQGEKGFFNEVMVLACPIGFSVVRKPFDLKKNNEIDGDREGVS